jgi:pantetheine-phosphate adenylyltransferase
MRSALYAGTFDPPTLGHLDIIQRASPLVDKLYVGIGENSAKGPFLLLVKERLELLQALTQGFENVEVVSFQGLTVDFALKNKISFLIRSFRDPLDAAFEADMADANRKMSGLETWLLPADPQYAHIRSTLLREIAIAQGNLSPFLPELVIEHLKLKRL